jgi:hypothetical protein
VTEEIRETAITAVAVSINIHRVPNEQIRALYDNIAAALASFSSKAAEEARARDACAGRRTLKVQTTRSCCGRLAT